MNTQSFRDMQMQVDTFRRERDSLREAVREYLRECDNPVPDYSLRRVLRDRLRTVAGVPALKRVD